MSIPRSVAQILSGHVTLGLEGIDPMYLNVYEPGCNARREWRGLFGSTAVIGSPPACWMDPISKAFVERLGTFSTQHAIPVVAFGKGERKDDVAARYLRRVPGRRGSSSLGATALT